MPSSFLFLRFLPEACFTNLWPGYPRTLTEAERARTWRLVNRIWSKYEITEAIGKAEKWQQTT